MNFFKRIGVVAATFALLAIQAVEARQMMTYQLENGLTVILNVDPGENTVFGAVVCKTGAKNDPTDATGMSHYLEHMMFKGTQEMGSTDWEKEKPHYEAAIDLFEQLRATSDPVAKKSIIEKINEEAKASGQYAIPNEFSNLVQAIGGVNLNASTGYDLTQYYCMFPAYELSRWADLYASLFRNPVFRGFHTEVETVFEEKNMYADNPMSSLSETFLQTIFDGHPYGVPIIGTTEHLKNPSLKKMIEYYQTWYVPSNMAVVLSGNIQPDVVRPILEQTFGTWKEGTVTSAALPELSPIKGKKEVVVKKLPYKLGYWAFNSVPATHPDALAYEVLAQVLTNNNGTGMLDRLYLDGDVISVDASVFNLMEGGRFIIQAIPAFDRNQYRQLSVGETEKMIVDLLGEVKAGAFDEALVTNIKNGLYQTLELNVESASNMALMAIQRFVFGQSVEHAYDDLRAQIARVDKAKLVELANAIFTDDCIVLQNLEGHQSGEKVQKPEFAQIDLPENAISPYRKRFAQLPTVQPEEIFLDFSAEMTTKPFSDGVKLFYKQNTQNKVFSMIIRYGAGSATYPTLPQAVSLMNRAGIMGQYDAQEFKEAIADLSCNLSIHNDRDYTYVQLMGKEESLAEACLLMSRLALLPKLDKKQLDGMVGNELMSREVEKENNNALSSALREYMAYGEESAFIKRLKADELEALTVKSLTGTFIRATQHEAVIHYYGSQPIDQVFQVLKQNLAFADGLMPSTSPTQKKAVAYEENTIFLVNQPKTKQSQLYFFMDGQPYQRSQQVSLDAFNQYFGGGFNGLVLQEIREYRAMAYTAGANWSTPKKENMHVRFGGMIGTQADKALDALKVYMDLMNNMPEKPERMEDIRSFLIQTALTLKPSPRDMTWALEQYMLLGYTEDPAKMLLPEYRALTFDDVRTFYQKHVKNKPIAIGILGDKKQIDAKELKNVGKVVNLSPSRLFN